VFQRIFVMDLGQRQIGALQVLGLDGRGRRDGRSDPHRANIPKGDVIGLLDVFRVDANGHDISPVSATSTGGSPGAGGCSPFRTASRFLAKSAMMRASS